MGTDTSLHSYHMLMRRNFNPIWPKLSKVTTPVSNPLHVHVGLTFWVVSYESFNCTAYNLTETWISCGGLDHMA